MLLQCSGATVLVFAVLKEYDERARLQLELRETLKSLGYWKEEGRRKEEEDEEINGESEEDTENEQENEEGDEEDENVTLSSHLI